MRFLAFCCALSLCSPAWAHDFGCDGKEVPKWVKASCCGKADVHAFRDLPQDSDGDYYIETHGRRIKLPMNSAAPSQDQCFYVFYNEAVADPVIYCFLAPLSF